MENGNGNSKVDGQEIEDNVTKKRKRESEEVKEHQVEKIANAAREILQALGEVFYYTKTLIFKNI
jgi:hypothetical protein